MKARVKSNQNLLRDRAKVQIDSLAESKGRVHSCTIYAKKESEV